MEIKISRSSRTCMACDRDFVHDESMKSLVRVSEGALSREDFCLDCWKTDRASTAYSVWSSRYYDPKVAEEAEPEVFSPLRHLFYEALESDDRHELAKAFLAAQLLRRQKAFRLVKESDEAEGEARVYLYADRIGNRLIEVRDPSFTYAEMEAGRGLLVTRLEALERPPSEEEPATNEADETGESPEPDTEPSEEETAESREDAEATAAQGGEADHAEER